MSGISFKSQWQGQQTLVLILPDTAQERDMFFCELDTEI